MMKNWIALPLRTDSVHLRGVMGNFLQRIVRFRRGGTSVTHPARL